MTSKESSSLAGWANKLGSTVLAEDVDNLFVVVRSVWGNALIDNGPNVFFRVGLLSHRITFW